MNKVTLIGRLTKDPELRFTPGAGKAVATFTLAINRRFKKDGQPEADFLPIVVWGKQAENTANYVGKGRLIGISGRIQTRNYEAKDGTRRYVTEIVAEQVDFLDYSKSNNNSSNNNSSNNNSSDNSSNNKDYGFDDDITPIDDGDIPF